MWFAPDRGRVFGCTANGQLETWDVQSLQRTQSTPLMKANNINPVLAAPEAGLLVLHQGQNRLIDVFDVETGEPVSVIQLPFRNGRLKAISADARRLIVSTDQLSLLVLDFPQRLPAGRIDLGAILAKSKLAATR